MQHRDDNRTSLARARRSPLTKQDGPHYARQKALADAVAGLAGAIVSLWVFYPLDVWKTQVQAAPSDNKPFGTDSVASPMNLHLQRWKWRSYSQWLAGLEWKTLHTAASNFLFFYLDSWILSWWIEFTARGRATRSLHKSLQPAKEGAEFMPLHPRPSASTRLVLSAVAAMINTFFTLPLDVLSTRRQTHQPHHDHDKDDKERGSLGDGALSSASSMDESQRSVYYDAAQPGGSNHITTSCEDQQPTHIHLNGSLDTTNSRDTPLSSSLLGSPTKILRSRAELCLHQLKPILHLWRGLWPALLLCSNPSIHYTVFDMAKAQVLRRKEQRSPPLHSGDPARMSGKSSLTMGEAFILGVLAKFVATMLTYPLIRAKTVLMLDTQQREAVSLAGAPLHSTWSTNLWQCLVQAYKSRGIAGLYQGCRLQLVHTLLKSALLMMVRERITRITDKLMLGEP